MNEQDFYIMIGEKFEKIDTIEANIIEIKNYLLDNGLLQDNSTNKEAIKSTDKAVGRLWKYVFALYFFLLGAVLRYGCK